MVDKVKIEQAVRLLLEGIGEDITREGLIDTPDRIARMCEEIYGGLGHEADQHLLKQFPVENNEIVLEKDITFYSMCEHHLMPFYGKAHLAYIPNGKVTGLSKLARTVEVYSRRPQIQERLTVQIADALERTLDPKGIMVMLEAEHTCMTMRGIKKPGSKTITTVTRGAFTEDKELQKMFLSMVKGRITIFQIWIVSIGSGGTRFIRNIIKKYRNLKVNGSSAVIPLNIFWMLHG